MQLLSPIKISYKNLMSTKIRSFLSILGIIIGVASVVVIFAAGRSAQALILDQVKGIGSNLIAVLPGASEEDGPPAIAFGIATTTLKYDDLEDLINKKKVPEVEAGAAYVSGSSVAISDNEEIAISFTGTTSDYVNVENADLVKGRFFTKEEERGMARVAVLGSEVAVSLFGGRNPLNEKIEIDDYNFTVIGVFKERGSVAFGMSSQDESVYIPLKTAQKLILGIDYLTYIRLKVEDSDFVDSAISNISATLRDNHDIEDIKDDDFSVKSQASALETVTNITDVLRYFLLAIGSVSLLVGGVGIMNIMLISVTQRIREVGLRKAVGAKNEDVLFQFLIESATVSLIGGVFGIILGVLSAFLISVVVQKFGYGWPFLISKESLVVAVTVSFGIGVLFGIYPAKKAAKISPMEALRYE